MSLCTGCENYVIRKQPQNGQYKIYIEQPSYLGNQNVTYSRISLDFLVAVGDSGLADLLLAALMASFRKELDSIIRCSEEMLDLLSSEEEEEDKKVLLEMCLLLATSFLPRSSSFSLLLSSLKSCGTSGQEWCDISTLPALCMRPNAYWVYLQAGCSKTKD